VDSQWAPDPAFPTVAFPNPEEPGALAEAIAVADREGIDLVLANDPDADRLCVMVRYNGTLRRLTGDELGAILGDALLAACSQERPFVARTIVSSDLLEKVAAYYGARCVETLTGFKWLWNASLAQVANGGAFAFAYEEAIGYSVGSAVRDKDGIGAAILVARLAASGVSVWERLVAIWKRHGAVATRLCSLVDAEPGGLARHAERIRRLRTEEVTHIGGIPVVERRDYKDGSSDLPPANCLAFFLQDGSRIMLRPSGTEPKLKIYLQVVEEWSDSVDGRVSARLKELEEAMVALAMNGESVVE
jgi:phosphomannomutase